AALRATRIKSLQKKNGMNKRDLILYIGQKLYIKGTKPEEEKIIVLIPQKSATTGKAGREVAPSPQTPASPVVAQTGAEGSPGPAAGPTEVNTRWVEHVVKPGETLWQISKMYNTKVEIIKAVNKLSSDQIQEGQKLRILSRE
ncbi:MAG: LysM peptidoglycan-binding domain-containing protein, partial [Bacteroidetes bacterium]